MTDKIIKLKWMWCGEKEQVANFPTGCILRVYKDNKWTENVVAQTWIPGYNYDGRETGFYLIDQSDDHVMQVVFGQTFSTLGATVVCPNCGKATKVLYGRKWRCPCGHMNERKGSGDNAGNRKEEA
jgi:hypothetical protein